MSKETTGKKRGISLSGGHIVVKNKKFKKSDIIVFFLCILMSLIIWIYATGAERKETAKQLDQLQQDIQAVQQDKT